MTTPRRTFLKQGLLAGTAVAAASTVGCSGSPDASPDRVGEKGIPPFVLDEVTSGSLQEQMRAGTTSAVQLTEQYLARIEAVDRAGPTLRSVIETNPEALQIAAQLDAERKAGKVRGPLHGLPVLIKDNIDTADRMMTSAGSLALATTPALMDAGIVQRMRAAGVVILGKANLSEWANIRSTRSTSGWSARGGLTRNPYALDRNACGSSAGTGAAIAANLATLGVGTETDGSIVCPANANGLVGIKPTVGLVSRSGIVPISHTQDTAGPMCRTVRDAAVLLSVLAGSDPRDSATAASAGHVAPDYTTFCDPAALKGKRLGVVRTWFNAGPAVDAVMVDVLAALTSAGAELVDPVEIPSLGGMGSAEFDVLLYELKADMAAYLATRGPAVPHRTLADLIRFNEQNKDTAMRYFGQEIFVQAEAKGPLSSPEYQKALATCIRLTRTQGMDRVLPAQRLDALIAPTGGPAWVTDLVNGDHFGGGSSTLSAVSGYPAITVPAGQVMGLPVGLSFMGPAWSEGPLIGMAYAFEQTITARQAPRFLDSIT